MGRTEVFGRYSQQQIYSSLNVLSSVQIASVNYGGHVTDDLDRRLLSTYMNELFCEAALNSSFYKYVYANHIHHIANRIECST